MNAKEKTASDWWHEEATVSEGCWYVVASFLSMPLGWLWHGWVVVNLWAWFVVPAFGLQAIGLPTAVGLGIILSVLEKDVTIICPKATGVERRKMMGEVSTRFLSPALALLFGWVVTLFR